MAHSKSTLTTPKRHLDFLCDFEPDMKDEDKGTESFHADSYVKPRQQKEPLTVKVEFDSRKSSSTSPLQ